MNKMQKLLNDINDIVKELPKEIYLWNNSGYILDTLNVSEYLADRNNISIEEVAWLALQNNVGLIISEDTFVALADELVASGYTEAEAFETLGEEWAYCDLTSFDNVPDDFKICYLLIDNLRCSDNIEIHS